MCGGRKAAAVAPCHQRYLSTDLSYVFPSLAQTVGKSAFNDNHNDFDVAIFPKNLFCFSKQLISFTKSIL